MGIKKKKIKKIFTEFKRGKADTTRRFGGLGLGLAISKALIDAHGGKIRVESRGKDQGATFLLELRTVLTPVGGDGAKPDQPAGAEQELAASTHRRVLVVDDHH